MTEPAAGSAARPPLRAPECAHAVLHDVMVTMRDGTRLATDIYLPAADGAIRPGRWPVVLERTPYDKARSQTNTPDGAFWARRGYACVKQDCRGRFGSEGEFISYPSEGDDGIDTFEWIRAQPWCDGRVAVTGSSYYASTAQAILCRNPRGLVAAVIRVGAGDYHEDGAWSGGAFQLTHNVNYTLGLAANGKEAAADSHVARAIAKALEPANAFALMRRGVLPEGGSVLSLAPSYDAWYQDWQRHELYDSFWHQDGYRFDYKAAADVPVLLIATWYDAFLGGMLDAFQGYAEGKSSPVEMIAGAGYHSSVYSMSSVAGDVDFGPDFPIDVPAAILRWFDQHVKGVDRGLSSGRAFHAFRIEGGDGSRTPSGNLRAGGSWRCFSAWPPPDAVPTPFHLGADLGLHRDIPPAGSLSYTHDPADPVPTVGGNVSSGLEIVLAGPHDQRGDRRLSQCRDTRPLAERPDVLVFRAAPLAEDTELSGMISVVLHVSSSAVDTDFTAKLIDEYPPSPDYPDGYAMNLQDGIVRARLRSFTQAGPGYRRLYAQRNEPLEPGVVVEVTIDLWAISVLVRAGHRIRLDVSSSNFPRFDVNPNTGEPFAGRRLPPVVARNTVHVGPSFPSRLILPLRQAV
ncbi:CocE/NonD family hydrolase [Rhodopila sp.]|jgi:putative CocE/NonD family hydrolase|uniref:CocE/NonD family hydrolase n=1 Tax=Rhodopila sp. TaxID=2480087 RepID=UPI002BA762F4|nr:CocE/NonD family hydrolase [Rhodopila sp.]HVZ07306.1 CocE/NonD family hydrolase [Rhodopila sp.]